VPSKHDLKRKRPETSTIVYSQPADTGTGQNIMTQVTYAVENLKNKATRRRYMNYFHTCLCNIGKIVISKLSARFSKIMRRLNMTAMEQAERDLQFQAYP
jgi:hypothetical protein